VRRAAAGRGTLSGVRIAAFYLTLLLAQGLLSGLFGTLPAPDLFLVAVLTWLGRLAPWQLLLAAYGVGLLQDVLGAGVLGSHAMQLAGAALAATVVRMQLSGSGILERLVLILAAQAGKWVVAFALLAWLSGEPVDGVRLLAVAISETVLTSAAALAVWPWAEASFRRAGARRRAT